MYDRAMQALQKMALEPIAETLSGQHSYGFRPMRSAIDAIEYGFNLLSRKNSAQWILDADVKSCFDQISHEWLVNNIPTNKRTLTEWLKAGYIKQVLKHLTKKGTPQGGIISPILANITLDGLEGLMRKSFKRNVSREKNEKVNLVRYAKENIFIFVAFYISIWCNELYIT